MINAMPQPPMTLRARVADIVAWADGGDWMPLFGGRTNSAWQLTNVADGAAIVLKLYRAPARNPLFPNEPHSEAALLRHLEATGLAPKLIASFDDPHGHCNLYTSIPGRRWQSGVAPVAELIKTLHAIPAPAGLRHSANGSAALLDQADVILSGCNDVEDLMALRPTSVVPPSETQVLLHCDVVQGNLIENDSGLHLIDWQCPALGDAAEDLATFLSPGMQTLYRGTALSIEEEQAFLAEFDAAQTIRYRMLAPFYHYRMAAYCLWQSQRDNPDYRDGYIAERAALAQAL